MNVLILSSASLDIDKKYLSLANQVSNFLATNNCDLIFGAASFSMMGECYQEFKKQNRKIYSFTTSRYEDDLVNLDNSIKIVEETTFDLKKSLFNHSDIIICLPGGLGTISEVLSFVEEKRSNNKNIPIIIYNEDGYYDLLIDLLKEMNNKKFVNNSIFNEFQLVSNMEEFKKIFIKEREEN